MKKIEKTPLTNAEKQKRYRERQKARGKKLVYSDEARLVCASDFARERLISAIEERLTGYDDDDSKWRYYTELCGLITRSYIKPDYSGNDSKEQQDDRARAKRMNEQNRGEAAHPNLF